MAGSIVQEVGLSNFTATETEASLTLPNVIAGDAIHVIVTWGGDNNYLESISDSINGNYPQWDLVYESFQDQSQIHGALINVGGGDTVITVTFSSAVEYIEILAREIGGGVDAIDTHSAIVDTTNISLTNTIQPAFVSAFCQSSPPINAISPLIQDDNSLWGEYGCSAHQTLNTTGSSTYSFNSDADNYQIMSVVIFDLSSDSTPTPTPTLTPTLTATASDTPSITPSVTPTLTTSAVASVSISQQLINLSNTPQANITGITAAVFQNVPTPGSPNPFTVIQNLTTDSSGNLAFSFNEVSLTYGQAIWLALFLDGSPALGGLRKITPTYNYITTTTPTLTVTPTNTPTPA